MANATNTIAGDVQLAGDLAGNNSAASPALTTVMNAPGQYDIVKFTVDSKGRITDASNATSADIINILPIASDTQKGIVQAGNGITASGGIFSIANASTTVKGVVKIGTGLTAVSGVVSVDTSLRATPSTYGFVKVGVGLDAVDGVLNLKPSTNSTLGGVKVGSGFTLGVDGTISIPDASDVVKGILSVNTGSGLTITGGVLSINTANMPLATNTVLGVVKSANASNINISAGAVDVGTNIPKLNANNVFTKTQRVQPVTLTSSTSITPDFGASNVFTLTLEHNATLNNPTNLVDGEYLILIKQDAVGGRTLGYGNIFWFTGSSTIGSGANSATIIKVTSMSGTLYCRLSTGYA